MRSFNLGFNARYKRAVALCEFLCVSVVALLVMGALFSALLFVVLNGHKLCHDHEKQIFEQCASFLLLRWASLLYGLSSAYIKSLVFFLSVAHSQTQQSSVCSTQNNIYQVLSYHLILFLSDDQFPCTFPAVVFGQARQLCLSTATIS